MLTVLPQTNQSKTWEKRVRGITNALDYFFENKNHNVMSQPCEIKDCNLNEQSFKAYLARFMGATVPLAPFTEQSIMTKINASAIAAAKQCSGGSDNKCGLRWTEGDQYDGKTGIGEQMSALEVIQSTLSRPKRKPVSSGNGGTSTGNSPDGGGNKKDSNVKTRAMTKGDKAGAGIMTALFALVPIGALVFLSELI